MNIRTSITIFSWMLGVASLSCSTVEYENGSSMASEAPAARVGAESSAELDAANQTDLPNDSRRELRASAEDIPPAEEGESKEGAAARIDEVADPEPEISGEPGFAVNVGFRVSHFGIMSPPLCVMSEDDNSCHNVDMMVNETFDSMLNDESTPMDLLGIFDHDSPHHASTVSFGAASCIREEGELISCAPLESTDFKILTMSLEETCIGGTGGMEKIVEPPCFATESRDLEIFLQGMLVGILEAQLVGTLRENQSGFDIEQGFITGFVPELMAQNWLLKTEGSEDEGTMSFDQLLHKTALYPNEDGEMGWNLVLGFSGSSVFIEEQ